MTPRNQKRRGIPNYDCEQKISEEGHNSCDISTDMKIIQESMDMDQEEDKTQNKQNKGSQHYLNISNNFSKTVKKPLIKPFPVEGRVSIASNKPGKQTSTTSRPK